MVVNTGHGISELADSVAAQIRNVAYVNGTQFTSAAAEDLAAELADVLPASLQHSYFLCGGAAAIEASVKLARQYWVERGMTSKWKVISRYPSYHGSTLTALSLSAREHYRDLYQPLLTDFPLQHFGVVPDIAVLGKGLAGGLAPLSALVAKREILDVLSESSGAFVHAQTFSHAPVMCAAGLANLRYMKQHDLVTRCARMQTVFFGELERLRDCELVGDVRGKGLLAGVEFVEDRETKAPFPRAARLTERVAERAFENGLIVWPNVGHIDGRDGDLIVLAPPFTVTETQVAEMVTILLESLEQLS